MAADGTLYIETAIDTDGFVAGGKDVEAAARRMARTVTGIGASAKIALKKQAEAFVQMNQQYSQQQQKVEELKNKLKELGNIKVETKEYAEIGKQIIKTKTKLENLLDAQERFLATGGRTRSSAYRRRQLEIEELRASIRYAETEQKELLNSGKAYTAPDTSKIEEKLSSEKQKLANMNNKLGNSYESLKQKVADYGGTSSKLVSIQNRLQKAVSIVGASIKGMGSALKKVSSALKSMVSALKKAVSAMLGFGRQTNKSSGGFIKSLKSILKYTIGIRSLFVLTNKIRSAFVTGMQNLAQYSDGVNASLSSLMSSLTRLKNSFATAFAPILSVVAPIMSSFIDMISRGATYVGMFFAALTGQDSFTRAKAVQQDYAASLDKTTKSTNKATKATKDAVKAAKGSLAPWDELNVIQMDLAESMKDIPDATTPELTPQDMFEEVPIKSSIKNFADKIKKMIKTQDWNGIGKTLGQQINKGLRKLNKAIRWDTVGDDITKGVDAITGIFNALVDEIDWEYMGDTAGEGINTLFKTLNQLMEKTDWKNLGKSFAEFANGLMNTVEWDEVGQFIGNKIMVLWDTLNGFVHELNWEDIGASAAEALNGLFKTVSFSDIADTLTTGINGAFKSLAQFTANFDWEEFSDNVKDGINTFLKKTDWDANGEALNDFLTEFLGALLDAAEGTDWEAFGKGVGDFLSKVDWETHFLTLLDVLKEVLGGIWKGLGDTSVGKFIEAVAVFKLGTKLMPFVNNIVEFFTGQSVGQKLTNAFKKLLGKSLTDAAAGEVGGGLFATLGGVLKKGTSKLGGVLKGALPLLSKGLLWGGSTALAAVGGYNLGKELSIQLFGGERKSVKDFVQDNIIGYQSGDISGAFNEFWKDVTGGVQPLSTEDIQVFDDLNDAILKIISLDELDGKTGFDLMNYLDELKENGESSSIAMQALKDKLSELGVSSETFDTALKLVQGGVESVGTEADITKDKASEMMQRINEADFTDIQGKISGFNTVLQTVDFARLVTEATNAIDEMGGIWENGKQVLGDKALQIYQEISSGLEPDANGYYTLANGQMVQYGKGIEDYEDNAKNTLDATLRSAIENALPDGYELYRKKGENEITGYTEGLESKKTEIEGAAEKVLDGVTKTTKAKATKEGKEAGGNLGEGLVSGIKSSKDEVNKTLMDLVKDDIKSPMRSGLQLGSPSKLFAQYAAWCGEGFTNQLSSSFTNAFSFFRNFGTSISNSIGDLSVIGHNAVIGMNNGMVEASDTLFENARKIASSVANIFRNVLKIHSPSKVMEELGGFTMEGFMTGMEEWLVKVEGLADRLSETLQSAMRFNVPDISVPVTLDPKTAGLYPRQIPVMAQGVVLPPKAVNYGGSAGCMAMDMSASGIKRAFAEALNEANTTGDNRLIDAMREAMSGMAVMADRQIIGYLQKKNSEYKAMTSGVGLFDE